MKRYSLLLLLALVALIACDKKDGETVIRAYPFPTEPQGVELGLSAVYSGVVGNYILFAGGCNFPDEPASEGGVKRYYDAVYCTPVVKSETDTVDWQIVGNLEKPAAYGYSVSMLGGVVCVGGNSNGKSLSTASLLMLDTDSMQLYINPLPDLPVKIDNMGGAATDTMLYVAGGNANGKPSNRAFLLDFTNLQQEWVELPPFPGEPRVQPVCAVLTNPEGQKALYVWGGFAAGEDERLPSVSPDGYYYSFVKGEWTHIPAPQTGGDDIFLGGGASAVINDTLSAFAGGVNAGIFLEALAREYKLKDAVLKNDTALQKILKEEGREYMLQQPEWYKFNNKVLVYNSLRGEWLEVATSADMARAGASLLHKEGMLYLIGGELKPGIRVPKMVLLEM